MALYRVVMVAHPGGEVMTNYGEYFVHDRAERIAKKESRKFGPNVRVNLHAWLNGREKVTVYRNGRLYKA